MNQKFFRQKAPSDAALKLRIQQERDYFLAQAMLHGGNNGERVREITHWSDEHIEHILLSRQEKSISEQPTT